MLGKEGGSAEVEVFYRGARPALLSSQNVINALEPSRSLPYVGCRYSARILGAPTSLLSFYGN